MTNLPTKGKPGRPKGLTKRKLAEQREADRRDQVQVHQRDDLEKLREDIDQARAGESMDSAAVSRLARSVQILHGLERDAYDLGGKGKLVNAVILLPTPIDTMAAWQSAAAGTFPKTAPAPSRCVGVVEDDLQGQAPEPEGGEK